jgi:5-methylcytosine-specific restriction endonuclease McrA
MEQAELIRRGWVESTRVWAHAQKRPELAEDFVQFFRSAFKPIPDPAQASFGVHSDRISLCIGNIWLAAIHPPRNCVFLLVDRILPACKFHQEPAKSTQRYTPLYWLEAKPLEIITQVFATEGVFNSYAEACRKILDSPISRNIIPKNQVKKVRLRELLSVIDDRGAQLIVEPTKDVISFHEGGIQEIVVELKKRNPELRKQAIAKHGHRCYCCNFSFDEFYGQLGAGYIEVHHKKPLSGSGTERTVSVEDVAVVCANCHRVLHRNGSTPIPVDELRDFIKLRTEKQESR